MQNVNPGLKAGDYYGDLGGASNPPKCQFLKHPALKGRVSAGGRMKPLFEVKNLRKEFLVQGKKLVAIREFIFSHRSRRNSRPCRRIGLRQIDHRTLSLAPRRSDLRTSSLSAAEFTRDEPKRDAYSFDANARSSSKIPILL